MESEKLKGAVNKVAGKAKQAAGDALGNPEMKVKGKLQEMKGHFQDGIGDAKAALEEE